MIDIQIIGAESVIARFQGAPERLRQALAATTLRLAIEAQRRVMETKLSGQVLHVRTGRLRRSINVAPIAEAGRVGARTGTNVSYGRIWELTGIRARTVEPRMKKALFWPGARHPVRRVEIRAQAPRPFLSIVLEEMRAQAREQMTAAAKGAI